MIYFTGDIHGEVFRVSEMIQRHKITSDDTIVLLGDVGMNRRCSDAHMPSPIHPNGGLYSGVGSV